MRRGLSDVQRLKFLESAAEARSAAELRLNRLLGLGAKLFPVFLRSGLHRHAVGNRYLRVELVYVLDGLRELGLVLPHRLAELVGERVGEVVADDYAGVVSDGLDGLRDALVDAG